MKAFIKIIITTILAFVFIVTVNGQVAGDFRTRQDGAWNNVNSWQRYSSGGVWQNSGFGENNPGQIPGVTAGATGNVSILNNHEISLDVDVSNIGNLTVGSGASGQLYFETVNNRSLSINGNLTIVGGGQLFVQNAGAQTGLITVGGNLTNSGTINLFRSITRYSDIIINGNTLSGNGTYTSFASITFNGTVTNSSTSNINIYGDFTCNNTFNTSSTGSFTFLGATSNQINGTGTSCQLRSLTLNKSNATDELEVLIPLSLASPTANGTFLTITRGVFKLSSDSDLIPYYGAQTICTANGKLWLNHAGATLSSVGAGVTTSSGTPTLQGILQITAGEFIYGSGNDIFTINNAASHLIIDGGNLTIYGGIAFSSTSQFTMSSGSATFSSNRLAEGGDALAAATSIVSFASTNATNAVSFTGGVLVISDPHPASGAGLAIILTGTAGYAYNFSGSTIQLGDGVSNKNGSADGFDINGGSRYSLGNLVVNNGTSSGTNRFVRLVTSDLIVNGELNIGTNVNDDFRINGRKLTLNGSLTCNGLLTGGATSNLTIGGNNTPEMLLPAIGGGLLNLEVNKTGTNAKIVLGGNLSLAAAGILTLTSGVLEIDDFNLTINNNAAAAILGTFSTISMISTEGNGYLIKNAASLQAVYPIGSNGYYSPMTLSSIAPATGTVSVRAVPSAITTGFLNKYWDVQTSIAGKTCTATFQYDPAEDLSTTPVVSYFEIPPGTSWQSPPSSGSSSIGANSFTITGNTPFTGYWSKGEPATLYSYQNGNWDNPTTWTTDPSGTLQLGNNIPGYGNRVVILQNRTVTLTSDVAAQYINLVINTAGNLDLQNFQFTSDLASMSGQGTLFLSEDNFPTVGNNTFVLANGGTTEYYGPTNITLPLTQGEYYNLTINKTAATATLISDIDINGTLYIKDGTLKINDDVSNVPLSLHVLGNTRVDAAGRISVGLGITNPAIGSVTAGGVAPFINYYTYFHTVIFEGNFINYGIAKFTNLTYPVYNQFPPVIADPTTGAATVYFRGTTNTTLECYNTTDFYNLVVDKGTGKFNQLTVYSSEYDNFRIFGANSLESENSGANLNLRKALWLRNGTVNLTGSIVIPSLTEGNTTGASTSDYYIPQNAKLVVDGTDVFVLVTADVYDEVTTAYSVGGGTGLVNGVIEGGYSSLIIYGEVVVENGYLSTRESGGIIFNNTASGSLTINGGEVDVKQLVSQTGASASFSQTDGDLLIRGRFKRSPLNFLTVGALADTAFATINTNRVVNGVSSGYGSFCLENASDVISMSGGRIAIYDVCDPVSQEAFDIKCISSNSNITGGYLYIYGVTGSVLPDAANYLINSSTPLTNFCVKRMSGGATVQLSAPLSLLENFYLFSGAFNANANNLTIGGDVLIESGTTFTTGTNTILLNGTLDQLFKVNLATALSLNNFSIDKNAGTTVNLDGSQSSILVSNDLRLESATLNDDGKTITVSGDIYNSGIHTGTGKIELNDSNPQIIDGDGNGQFENITLNNTNSVTTSNNIRINGDLTFSQNILLSVTTYEIVFGPDATVIGANASRYIATSGTSGDGGVTKFFNASNKSFTYPFGAPSTARPGTPAYTPATLTFGTNPTTFGSVKIVPVGYEHPAVTNTGRSLSYFWRVSESGFTMGSGTVSMGFTYDDADVVTGGDITENGYVAAMYNILTASWLKGTSSDVTPASNIFGEPGTGSTFENVGFIDGDYTAGDDISTDPFGTPEIYYSRQNGNWNTLSTWSLSGHAVTDVPATPPTTGDIVIIGNGHTVNFGTPANYLTTANTETHFCSILQVETGGVLDTRYNPGSNFGMVLSHPNGNGTIRVTCRQNSGSTFVMPGGDFTDFNQNSGTTELYTTNATSGTTFWLPQTTSSYGNLIISPLGGSNIIFGNLSITIYGNCIARGQNADSWFLPTWNGNYPTAPTARVSKTITIMGDLDIQGGSFGWYGNNGGGAQNIVVYGDVIVANAGGINVWSANTSQSMQIGGSLINNTANAKVGGAGSRSYVNLNGVNVTFFGNTDEQISTTNNTSYAGAREYTDPADPIYRCATIFSQLTINKGTSQLSTLTCTGGTIGTPTNNWLQLQNGTLNYNLTNPFQDFTITTTSTFTIPSTAGLNINLASNTGNRNVLIANAAANNNDLYLNGKLAVINGNVYIGQTGGPANNNDIEYSADGSSELDIQGGVLVVNGQIRRSTSSNSGILNYSQNAGSVTINGNAADASRAKFEVLNAGSSFTMTGGTLRIVRGGGTTYGDFYLRPASSSVTGGTILFSHTMSGLNQVYGLESSIPLYNITVLGRVAATAAFADVSLMTSDLVANGTVTLSNVSSRLISNNINVTFNGDFVNHGTYSYGTNTTTFNGTTQAISGTSTSNFYNLVVSSSNTLTPSANFSVFNNLTLESGNLVLSPAKRVVVVGNIVNNASYTDDNTTGGIRLTGTALQTISGTGSFGRLELNNSFGAKLLNSINLQGNMALTSGILNIQSYQLTLYANSLITGTPYSPSKMIISNGVVTDLGIKKFFPVIGALTSFKYPVGINGKYTPVTLDITNNNSVGYINIIPVNSAHGTMLQPDSVLQYYWYIQSSGISSFTANVSAQYQNIDVAGIEADYVTAHMILPGDYWYTSPTGAASDSVNEATDVALFSFSSVSNISGYYTAGVETAIPDQIPTYRSKQNGNWTDVNTWQAVGSAPPCPAGGPNGYYVVIDHDVTLDDNYCFATTTTINNILRVEGSTFGHDLGIVDGNGTLYLENSNPPAGNFTNFINCASSATIEFGGTGVSYTIGFTGVAEFSNLTVSGTGNRYLPNYDITVCKNLIIDQATLNNSLNNSNLFVGDSLQLLNSGEFTAGTGKVVFNGSGIQYLGGPTGNFTGASSFYDFEIDNEDGIVIGTGGLISIAGTLYLTNGNITTTGTNRLEITNTSENAVVPAGGSEQSFIDGPLTKNIISGQEFLFPLGKGTTLGHDFFLTARSAGISSWTAEYFTPNPTYLSVNAPYTVANSSEYWGVKSNAAKLMRAAIWWDEDSDLTPIMTQNGISDLFVGYSTTSASWSVRATNRSGGDAVGSVYMTVDLTISTLYRYFTIVSKTQTIPFAKLDPDAAVCGSDGIPITIITNIPTPLNYTLDYTIDGVAQATETITSLPYTLPTTNGPGEYTLTAFKYDGGVVDGVVGLNSVFVYDNPDISAAGPNQSLCGLTSTVLAANLPGSGSGTWSIVDGLGGTIISNIDYNSDFIGLLGNTYTLRWTIANGDCESADDVVIGFPYTPAQPSAFIVASANVCQTDTTVEFTVPEVSGATSYTWNYTGNGETIDAFDNTAYIDFDATATNGNVEVQANNGCGTSMKRIQAVTVQTIGIADFSYAGSPYCHNAANPVVTLAPGAQYGTFTSDPAISFVDILDGEIDIALSDSGSYIVTNTLAPVGYCPQVAATAPVTITALGSWFGANNNWLDPANWVCMTVPTNTIDVHIPNTAAFMPEISANNAVCRKLEIDNGASLTVNNVSFSVWGDFINDGTYNNSGDTLVFPGTSAISGTTTTQFNTIQIPNGGVLTAPANMSVSGDLIVESGGTFNHNSGSILLNGSTEQHISGSVIVNNMTLNNSMDTALVLQGPLTVQGSFTLTDGIVLTDAVNVLRFGQTATTSSGSNQSYIDGPVNKVGNTPFVYPLGDSGVWARMELIPVANWDATTEMQCRYFHTPPSNRDLLDVGVDHISNIEYWDISRISDPGNDNTTNFVMYFEDEVNSAINVDGIDFITAHFEGGLWVDKGGVYTDNGTSGRLTSTTPLTQYSPSAPASSSPTGNPLPVELIDFSASVLNKTVILKWSTASEKNNDYFVVERSTDGNIFDAIGIVEGTGNSSMELSYSYEDLKYPHSNSCLYYRLKQVDYDGRYTYSPVRIVILSESNASLTVNMYPNPASRIDDITLDISGLKPGETLGVTVQDISGRIILNKDFVPETEYLSFKLLVDRFIKSGSFILTVENNNSVVTKQFNVK